MVITAASVMKAVLSLKIGIGPAEQKYWTTHAEIHFFAAPNPSANGQTSSPVYIVQYSPHFVNRMRSFASGNRYLTACAEGQDAASVFVV